MSQSKLIGFVAKHRSEIFLALAGVGGAAGVACAVFHDTPKALKLKEQAEKEKGEDLTKKEIIKATWMCFIPTLTVSLFSISCLIGAYKGNMRSNAALAAAMSLSDKALSEYKDKVVETVGEKKVQEIQQKISKDKIDQTPIVNNEVVITGRGDTLFMDSLCGRYFKSDISDVKIAVANTNTRIVSDLYASLNDLYEELHLKPVDIGDDLGWGVDTTGKIEFRPDSALTDNGEPCFVLDFSNCRPKYYYE